MFEGTREPPPISRREEAEALWRWCANSRFEREALGINEKGQIWVRGEFDPQAGKRIKIGGYLCSTVLKELGNFMLAGIWVTEKEDQPTTEPLFILGPIREVSVEDRRRLLTGSQLEQVMRKLLKKEPTQPLPKMKIFSLRKAG